MNINLVVTLHGPLSRERFQQTYPVLLRQSGYYTGFTGKFGYAVKDDEFANSSYAKGRYAKTDFDWWKGWPSQGYYQTSKNKYMVEYAEEYPHVSTALGASSIDFIREAENKKYILFISKF